MGLLPTWLGGTTDQEDQDAALAQQATQAMGQDANSQSVNGFGTRTVETTPEEQAQLDAQTAEYNKQIQQSKVGPQLPQAMGQKSATPNMDEMAAAAGAPSGLSNIYQGALSKLGSPQGLSTLAGLGAGVLGMNTTAGGVEQQNKAYQDAINQVNSRKDVSADAYNSVKDDTGQLAMRQQALQGFSDRANMGLTPEEQAQLQGIQRQSAQQFKAANATIGQDMARRGVSNSGLGLAQSMGAADQAQQQQAVNGQNVAAMSFQNKQAALNNLANQSGQALNSDYQRQMGKASGLTNINQFNSQQQNQANQAAANIRMGQGTNQATAAGNKGAGIVNLAGGVISSLNPNAVTMSPTAAATKPTAAPQAPAALTAPAGAVDPNKKTT